MSSSAPPPDSPPAEESPIEAVRGANARFYEAFEALDLPAMEAVWSADETVTCVHPGWTLLAGRAAVIASWTGIFRGTEKIRFTLRDVKVFLRAEAAWVVLIEEIEAHQGDRVVQAFSHTTNLFALEDGAWRLVHHHAAPILDVEAREGPASDGGGPRILH